jgi:hypothetical protein
LDWPFLLQESFQHSAKTQKHHAEAPRSRGIFAAAAAEVVELRYCCKTSASAFQPVSISVKAKGKGLTPRSRGIFAAAAAVEVVELRCCCKRAFSGQHSAKMQKLKA